MTRSTCAQEHHNRTLSCTDGDGTAGVGTDDGVSADDVADGGDANGGGVAFGDMGASGGTATTCGTTGWAAGPGVTSATGPAATAAAAGRGGGGGGGGVGHPRGLANSGRPSATGGPRHSGGGDGDGVNADWPDKPAAGDGDPAERATRPAGGGWGGGAAALGGSAGRTWFATGTATGGTADIGRRDGGGGGAWPHPTGAARRTCGMAARATWGKVAAAVGSPRCGGGSGR